MASLRVVRKTEEIVPTLAKPLQEIFNVGI